MSDYWIGFVVGAIAAWGCWALLMLATWLLLTITRRRSDRAAERPDTAAPAPFVPAFPSPPPVEPATAAVEQLPPTTPVDESRAAPGAVSSPRHAEPGTGEIARTTAMPRYRLPHRPAPAPARPAREPEPAG